MYTASYNIPSMVVYLPQSLHKDKETATRPSICTAPGLVAIKIQRLPLANSSTHQMPLEPHIHTHPNPFFPLSEEFTLFSAK
jgi:hypothetical protein